MSNVAKRPADLTEADFQVHVMALQLQRKLSSLQLPYSVSPLVRRRVADVMFSLERRRYSALSALEQFEALSEDLSGLIEKETQESWIADECHTDGGAIITEISRTGKELSRAKTFVDDLVAAVLDLESLRRAEGFV